MPSASFFVFLQKLFFMRENNLDIYLNEIGRTPLLTEEQERQLAERIQKGDERALNKLVESNLRLVVATARPYQGHGMSIDDLISEGNIGLMKAAAKFNPEGRMIRFAGFAVPYIRRQIEKNLSPNPSEVVRDGHSITFSREEGKRKLSLDAPLGIKPNLNLLSVLTDRSQPSTDSRLYSGAQLEAIERALTCLNEREKKVISAYFGIDQEHATMAEIASDMDLKRERVRQIRNRAVRRMKAYLRSE